MKKNSLSTRLWSIMLTVVLSTSMVPVAAITAIAEPAEDAATTQEAFETAAKDDAAKAESSKDAAAKADAAKADAKDDAAKEQAPAATVEPAQQKAEPAAQDTAAPAAKDTAKASSPKAKDASSAAAEKPAAAKDEPRAAADPEPAAEEPAAAPEPADAYAELADARTGVEVKGVLPAAARLSVKELDAKERAALNLDLEEGQDFTAYDISLGEDVQPSGKVEVTLPIPASFDGSLKVLYVNDTIGQPEKMKGEKIQKDEDAYVYTFKTTHFSTYALVNTPKKQASDAAAAQEPAAQEPAASGDEASEGDGSDEEADSDDEPAPADEPAADDEPAATDEPAAADESAATDTPAATDEPAADTPAAAATPSAKAPARAPQADVASISVAAEGDTEADAGKTLAVKVTAHAVEGAGIFYDGTFLVKLDGSQAAASCAELQRGSVTADDGTRIPLSRDAFGNIYFSLGGMLGPRTHDAAFTLHFTAESAGTLELRSAVWGSDYPADPDVTLTWNAHAQERAIEASVIGATTGTFGTEFAVNFTATADQGDEPNIYYVSTDAARAGFKELADMAEGDARDVNGITFHKDATGYWFELDSSESAVETSFTLTAVSDEGAADENPDPATLSVAPAAGADLAAAKAALPEDPAVSLTWLEAQKPSSLDISATGEVYGYFDVELGAHFKAVAGRDGANVFHVRNVADKNRALAKLLEGKQPGDTVDLGATDRLGNPVAATVTEDGFTFELDNSANNWVEFDLDYIADPQGSSNAAKMNVYGGVGADEDAATAASEAKFAPDVNFTWSDSGDKMHYTINLIWDTSIEADKYDQEVVTTKQTTLNPKYKLDLQTSSVNYEVGQFKMELPYALWAYRDAKNGTNCSIPVDISIPKKGSASSNVKFEYEIVYDPDYPKDLTKAKLVITNSQYLPAGTNATITVKYAVDPWQTVDLSTAAITVAATAQATNQADPETAFSNTITYKLDTGFDNCFLKKTSTWTSTEAAAVYEKPSYLSSDLWDPESYNMVKFHINYGASGFNQPLDFSFLTTLPEGAELVAVTPHTGGYHEIAITPGEEVEWVQRQTKKSTSSSDGDYWFYVRFPRTSDGDADYHVRLDMDAVVSDDDTHEEPVDYNDKGHCFLEWDFHWKDYEFKPVGTESYSKAGWGDDYIETIKSGNTDVEFSWRMYVTTLRWYLDPGETQYIQLTDDAHFWKYVPKTYGVNQYRNVSDMHWMDGDTYEFSKITSIVVQHYDLSHVDGSRTYPDFPGGTLVVQASKDGKTWDTVNTIEVPEMTDRTSAYISIPDSGKFEFPKGSGYTRLRVISPEVGRGSLNVEVNFYTRMKAQSDLVQQWLEECDDDDQVYVRNYAAYQHFTKSYDTVEVADPVTGEKSTVKTDKLGDYVWDDQLGSPYSVAARDGVSDGQSLTARDVVDDQYYDGTQTGYVRRAYANGQLRHFGHSSQIQKKTGEVENDTANHRAIVPFGIFEEEIITGKMGDQYTNIYKDFSQDSGVFYDLLPVGYHYLEGSMESLTVNAQDANATVEVIDNYKGTGREMLIVHVSKPADPEPYTIAGDTNLFNQESLSTRSGYYLFNKNENTRYHSNYTGNPHTGFRIDFKTYISWKDLKDHGQEVNLVAFQRDDGQPIGVYKSNSNTTADDKGYPDRQPSFPSSDSQVIKEFKKATVSDEYKGADADSAYAFYDVDGDGKITPKSTMYAYSNANPQVTAYVETGITKDIIGDNGYKELGATYAKAGEDAGWNKLDRTTLTGSYQYRITTKVNCAEMSDLIVYDTLEDAKNKEGARGEVTWKGTLSKTAEHAVDVSEAEALGFAPVVYYSTAKGLDYNSITGREKNIWIEDASVWTKASEFAGDLADVTAIAVDLRKMADGSDAVIMSKDPNNPNDTDIDSVSFVVNMTAPDKYPVDPEMIYAINRPAYTCYQQAWFSAEGADFSDIGLRVKILLPVEVKVKKTSIGADTPDNAAFTLTLPNGYIYKFTYADFTDGEFLVNQDLLDAMPATDEAGTAKPDYLPVGEYSVQEDAASAEVSGKTLQVVYDEGTNGAINVAGKTADESIIGITNIYNEPVEIPVVKTWDDADDQDGLRSENITVKLLRDGKDTGKTLVLDADSEWKGSFASEGDDVLWKLDPKTGAAYAYGISEVSVKGYETETSGNAEDGYTVTNTYTPATTQVSVSKAWSDADNQDGIRPESVTVRLLAGGEDTGKSAELNAGNQWTATFEGLPAKADGEAVKYTVEEDAVDGYTATVSGSAAAGYVVTNEHAPETVSVEGAKTWDDADSLGKDGYERPASIDVTLTGTVAGDDGQAETVFTDTKSVSGGDDATWSFSWTGLAKKSAGKDIAYTVAETTPAGFAVSAGEGENALVNTPITGKRISPVELVLKKVDAATDTGAGLAGATFEVENAATGDVQTYTTGEDGTVKLSFVQAGTYTLTETAAPAGYQASDEVRTIEVSESGVDSVVLEEADGQSVWTWLYHLVFSDGSGVVDGVLTVSDKAQTTEVSATKVWDDADNQDGLRSDVAFDLMKSVDGAQATVADTKTVAKDATGDALSVTWSDLPVAVDGKAISYEVVEQTELDGYETSVSGDAAEGYTFTNKHVPATTEASVAKKWDDADDQDGIRPETLTATLSNGTEVELNEANGWKATVKDLPKFKSGKEIEYTWTESEVEGYELTDTAVADGTTTFTNKHVPETVEVSVAKKWDDEDNQDGIRPESLTATLSNGTEVELNEDNNWTATVKDLPKFKSGKEIEYTWTEPEVDGYELTGTETADGKTTFTNKHVPETVEVSVAKKWDDANDQDGARPETLTVTLSDGTEVELNEANGWAATVKDLPKFANGQEISYTWTEPAVEGYELVDTTVADGTTTFTNRHVPETTEATVKKAWDDADDQDGKRPDSIEATLSNGATVTLDESNGWTATVKDLPKFEAGQEVDYAWTEAELPEGYSLKSISRDGAVTTITNAYTPGETSATVRKVWDDAENQDGIRPASIEATLSNGTTVALDESNSWTATVTGLPEYQAGKKVEYTWTEADVDGYELAGTAVDGTVTTFTNKHVPETVEVSVAKKWDDADNQDGIRPETLTATLSDGTEVELNEANGWTATVKDLPKYANGKEISYTWTEAEVEGYELTDTAVTDGTTTFTNKHVPATVAVSVAKKWDDTENQDGKRPDSIEATLSNGTTVTLDESNGWTATVEDLPKYAAGKEVEYTWTEADVEGYELADTTVKDGTTTFTNKHVPETVEVSVAKKWDDADNQDGIRPDAVNIQLLANGEAQGESVALSGENEWAFTWSDLPKFAVGEEIAYTVEETDVADGYQVAVTGDASEGFTVTNTHEPATVDIAGTKSWNDAGFLKKDDYERPASIGVTIIGTVTDVDDEGVETPRVVVEESLEVTAEDGWQYAWSGLPQFIDGLPVAYEIEESGVEGYIVSQPEGTYDLVNTPTEENVDPETPGSHTDEPDNPGTPDKPGSDNPGTPGTTDVSRTSLRTPSTVTTHTITRTSERIVDNKTPLSALPRTGDEAQVGTAALLALLAAGLAVFASRRRRDDGFEG